MQVNLLPRTFKLFCVCLFLAMGLTWATAAPARAEAKKEGQNLKPTELKFIKMEGNLELYKTIKIKVANLDNWVKVSGNDYSTLELCIDGNILKGLRPDLIENNTKLRYDLNRTPENKEAWNAILKRKGNGLDFTRKVSVTIYEKKLPIPIIDPKELTEEERKDLKEKYPLIVINKSWFTVFVIVFAGSLFLFWWYAKNDDLIRESGPPAEEGKQKPYSLARTQMACWFFVIIISFVFIWLVTGDLYALTPSVLGLMGISGATGLAAAVVDSGKLKEIETLKEKRAADAATEKLLEQEKNELDIKIKGNPAAPDLEAQKVLLATKTMEWEKIKSENKLADQKINTLSDAIKLRPSKNFIADILNDDNGISFHRFQMVSWTIVLIIIFISKVCNTFAMPEFDATLLALMGISSGTYIGFKLPSQQG